MDYKNIYYPESNVGGFTDIDGTIAFYLRVNSLVKSSSTVLDIGCGRGDKVNNLDVIKNNLLNFKGRCKKVIGIDVDDKCATNPTLDKFILIDGKYWGIKSQSIDICLADNVLEHIEFPNIFFSECRRVLKPGGYLCIRTPNLLSYIGILSKIIPNKFHQKIVKNVQKYRNKEDIYPIYYRCNTKIKIFNTLERNNFVPFVYGYEAEPSYLSFSRILYSIGVLHQKFAPNVFKLALFAFAKKR